MSTPDHATRSWIQSAGLCVAETVDRVDVKDAPLRLADASMSATSEPDRLTDARNAAMRAPVRATTAP